MKNRELAVDHLRRASVRLLALDVLFEHDSWADVVRESQEVVELALKGLLRACGVEAPRIHDVSEILLQEAGRLPASIQHEIKGFAEISRQLRRDRDLAFCGSDDLTPSTFYRKRDAVTARDAARKVVELVRPAVFAEEPHTE